MKTLVIDDLIPCLESSLPETYRLLRASRIAVHPSVRKITLHGSRGPAGGFRPDSDIDLGIVTNVVTTEPEDEMAGSILAEVLKTCLENSEFPVEADLAAIYDRKECGLRCYDANDYPQLICPKEETGCIGIYKIQKGFSGFVPPISEVKEAYPLITLWER